MESSLHRELKAIYAGEEGLVEQRLGRFRIDVVVGDLLIEVQHGGLAAIRDKVRKLCRKHDVLVVKPVVMRRRIVRLDRPGGEQVGSRWSPKRGAPTDLFDEFVHFTRAFPHRRLTVEAPLVEIEELRYPGHGRRRRWRRNDFEVDDQRLVRVCDTLRFKTATDLWGLIPGKTPASFDTAELAKAMDSPRWIGQRAAYTLREMGAIRQVGKRKGAWLYERVSRRRRAA